MEVVVPRELEKKRLSNLTISLLILPWMVEVILVNLVPLWTRGRPHHVSASGHPEHGSGDRLLARLGQLRECVCRVLHSSFSHSWWDQMADLDAVQVTVSSHNFPARAPRGILPTSELQQTRPNHRHTVASSVVWVVPFAVIVTDGSFDFWNRFLLLWSRVTFTHNMKCTSWKHSDFSLASSRSCPKRRRILFTEFWIGSFSSGSSLVKKHCSRDSVWRAYFASQNMNLELRTRSCKKNQCCFCERVVLGKGAKVLISGSAQGICPPHREEEVDGQEDEQDDRREDRQQGEESGEVEENQTHNMSAWRWRMRWCEVRCAKLTTWATHVRVIQMWTNEKMWRVRCAVHTPRRLQQIAISCKRSDYNKKNLAKCHFGAA